MIKKIARQVSRQIMNPPIKERINCFTGDISFFDLGFFLKSSKSAMKRPTSKDASIMKLIIDPIISIKIMF